MPADGEGREQRHEPERHELLDAPLHGERVDESGLCGEGGDCRPAPARRDDPVQEAHQAERQRGRDEGQIGLEDPRHVGEAQRPDGAQRGMRSKRVAAVEICLERLAVGRRVEPGEARALGRDPVDEHEVDRRVAEDRVAGEARRPSEHDRRGEYREGEQRGSRGPRIELQRPHARPPHDQPGNRADDHQRGGQLRRRVPGHRGARDHDDRGQPGGDQKRAGKATARRSAPPAGRDRATGGQAAPERAARLAAAASERASGAGVGR